VHSCTHAFPTYFFIQHPENAGGAPHFSSISYDFSQGSHPSAVAAHESFLITSTTLIGIGTGTGALVGTLVGAGVGAVVGFPVGKGVVGVLVGASVGAGVGTSVGTGVGSSVFLKLDNTPPLTTQKCMKQIDQNKRNFSLRGIICGTRHIFAKIRPKNHNGREEEKE
jgi:hypothetical protein